MTEAAFNTALALFQAEIPTVGKDRVAEMGSYSYSFADLTAITEKALPLLAKHGLSFSANPTMTVDFGFVLKYELRHAEGHKTENFYPLPDPVRNSPQQIGSAVTYARRYSLCAATGISPGGEDDDGQTAQEARSAPAAPPVDPMREAKARVWTAAQTLGWDRQGLAEDYAREHGGEALGNATTDDLVAYAVDLEMRTAA